MLGHKNIATTQKYLGVNYQNGRDAVEVMAIHSQLHIRSLLSGSFQFLGGELKQTADETLFLELALRGYDLSKLRDEEVTAEIIKIG